jgi:hypothetical protein
MLTPKHREKDHIMSKTQYDLQFYILHAFAPKFVSWFKHFFLRILGYETTTFVFASLVCVIRTLPSEI